MLDRSIFCGMTTGLDRKNLGQDVPSVFNLQKLQNIWQLSTIPSFPFAQGEVVLVGVDALLGYIHLN